ncbi:MAG: hypothetical protein U9Q83_00095 [Bacteroidota bacterium]|nr:hypothetical protein [Bacteroidota bacterium]
MPNNNRLLLIYALQKYYLHQQKRGVKIRCIYEQITALYPMSKTTFYNYMSTAPSKYLKTIEISKLQKFTTNVITSLQRITDEA